MIWSWWKRNGNLKFSSVRKVSAFAPFHYLHKAAKGEWRNIQSTAKKRKKVTHKYIDKYILYVRDVFQHVFFLCCGSFHENKCLNHMLMKNPSKSFHKSYKRRRKRKSIHKFTKWLFTSLNEWVDGFLGIKV